MSPVSGPFGPTLGGLRPPSFRRGP
jgi:hypothetical protein